MAQVQQVGSDLNLAAFLCKAARLKLSSTKSAMTKTCFSVLRSHKQTCVIEQVPLLCSSSFHALTSRGGLGSPSSRQVISTLTTMQSITDVENRVRHAANQGDFTGAVEMCLECQRRTVDLSSFVAARGLAGRIRTAYSSVQRSLDAALRDSCRQFDPVRYKSVSVSLLSTLCSLLCYALPLAWLALSLPDSTSALPLLSAVLCSSPRVVGPLLA